MSYFCSQELICRDCWELYNEGTFGNPDYRPPPCPERYEEPGDSSIFDGTLVAKGDTTPLGTVKGFNPRKGFCNMVARFAYPCSGEAGSLDMSTENVIHRAQVVQNVKSAKKDLLAIFP